MNAPMLVPFSGLVSGIALAISDASLIMSAALFLSASIIYFLIVRLSENNPAAGFRNNKYHYIWIFLAFAATGIFSYDVNRPYKFVGNPDNYVRATAIIRDITQSTSGDKAIVKILSVTDRKGNSIRTDNLTVILKCDALTADIDDSILIPLKLKTISDPDNYFSTGYTKYLNNKGIYYESRCTDTEINITGHNTSLHGIAASCRDRLETHIEKSGLKKETQNFLISILLGDRAYLDRSTRDLFSDAGISHILALSGMHVAIIGGIFLWLLFPMNFFGLYKYRLMLSALLILIYAFISGWAPSTIRATLMTVSMIICLFAERKNSAWNALLFSVFLILLFSPASLTDIGLQLSFVCVASLIFFVKPLTPIGQHDHPALHRVYTLMLTTLVATGCTWCLSALYFGKVPVAFLPANIITLPLLPVYLVTAIIYLFLYPLGNSIISGASIAKGLEWILDSGLAYLKDLLRYMTNDASSSINFSPSAITIVLWFCFITAAAIYLNGKRNRHLKWGCISLAICFISTLAFPADANPEESFIIQRGRRPVSILYRDNATMQEKNFIFKRNAISVFELAGKKIINVDCPIKNLIIDKNFPQTTQCDILVLAGGIREPLPDILTLFTPGKIIIHPSIRKKREAELISQADSLGIPHHSIRISGPYRY